MPRRLAPLVIVALLVGSFVGSVALVDPPMPGVGRTYPDPEPAPAPGPDVVASGFTLFDSAADFDTYLNTSQRRFGTLEAGQTGTVAGSTDPTASKTVSAVETTPRGWSSDPDRAVQSRRAGTVAVGDSYVYYAHGVAETGETSVIDISGAGSPSADASISRAGRVVRAGDGLVVFGQQTVTGYDVSAPTDPERAWNRSLAGDVVTAQARDGAVFLVLATGISSSVCPVEPLGGVTVRCTDIYHPGDPVPVDSVYTVVRLDPASGRVQETVSVVGSRRSVVDADENGLYLTVTEPTPRGGLLLDFLLTDARSLLPIEVVGELERVRGAKMSDRAAYRAARQILDEWLSSLSAAKQRVLDHRFDMRYRTYVAEHRRSLQTTHVVRLHEDTLALAVTGTVPGVPTGKPALDERAGRLRVATTVQQPPLRWGPVRSTTGVYVLDSNLDVTGSATGLHYGQAPAVQFIGETALVGSRSETSIRAVDLSDPTNPHLAGDVALPTAARTFSPVSADHVLGVSEADGRVTATLVNASNPADPHIDARRTFPTSQAAVVADSSSISTESGVVVLRTATGVRILTTPALSTVATVSVDQPRDAISLDGHLYVFGRTEIVVLDDSTWAVERRIRL